MSVWAQVSEGTCVSKSLCASVHCVFPGTGGQKQKLFVPEENRVALLPFLSLAVLPQRMQTGRSDGFYIPSLRTGSGRTASGRRARRATVDSHPSFTGTASVLRGECPDGTEGLFLSSTR